MKLKIYRVPASHPCQAVIRGAELKGIEHKVVDLAPPTQALVATLLFGSRTVPAMKIIGGPNGNEKAQTTLKCLRALESLQPEPAFYPAEAGARERVLAAEAWGVGEIQDLARRIIWIALAAKPAAMLSFDSNLPLPDALARPAGPAVIWAERKINNASDDQVRADLEILPTLVDEIDEYIAAGVIGNEQPNAADLTILSNLWMLRSIQDLRPFIDSRPAGRKTREVFGEAPGDVPAGAIDAAWLTAVNAAHGAAVSS
ncbi:MAG: glutathione S-transferase family protein [Solirubrobacterales bacterium]